MPNTTKIFITPGSELNRAAIEQDKNPGEDVEDVGATVLTNA